MTVLLAAYFAPAALLALVTFAELLLSARAAWPSLSLLLCVLLAAATTALVTGLCWPLFLVTVLVHRVRQCWRAHA